MPETPSRAWTLPAKWWDKPPVFGWIWRRSYEKEGRGQREELEAGRRLIAAAVLCAAVALFIWEQQPEYFTYRDQQLEAIKGVDRNHYDPQAFTQQENGWITYEKNGKKALTGIDVSVYQGDIDWEAVAQSGVEFAIIRLGYRGYSQGAIQLDSNFEQNMRGLWRRGWMWASISSPRPPQCWRRRRRPTSFWRISGATPSPSPWSLTGNSSPRTKPGPMRWMGRPLPTAPGLL